MVHSAALSQILPMHKHYLYYINVVDDYLEFADQCESPNGFCLNPVEQVNLDGEHCRDIDCNAMIQSEAATERGRERERVGERTNCRALAAVGAIQ